MRYQMVIGGFGGQGVVFLVKVLSLCAAKKGYDFLGTENHGMSQRGGSVSSHIKIGDFSSPVVEKGSADLVLGLDENEGLLNLIYLKKGGWFINNAPKCPEIEANTFCIDANTLAEIGVFDVKGLNVFMLGITLSKVKNFPFSVEEVKAAIEEFNPKFAKQNFEILDKALEYGKN
ncbi:2-oxoacid:acceptor oxidoreductase family protein [Caminibacter sp.]